MQSPDSAVGKFFSGVTEYTFHVRLGVPDEPLIDYLSDLLIRFLRIDGVYRVRGPQGARMTQIAMMMGEAERRIGEARRETHRHIGDFALFWAGVYPEALPSMQRERHADHLLDFRREGRKAYRIAAELPAESPKPPADVLERIAEEFDLCAYGLGEVRREWERRDAGGADDVPVILG